MPLGVRDIRSFFKPAPERPLLDTINVQPTGPRIWPSPRIEARHADPSARAATESPTQPPKLSQTPTASQDPGPENAANRNASTSFSSLGSGVSNNSRRLWKNGEELVTNSDSETDSSDSLDDLDAQLRLPPSRRVGNTEIVDNEAHAKRQTRSNRLDVHTPGKREPITVPPRKKVGTSLNLSVLAKTVASDKENAQRIATIRAQVDQPDEAPPSSQNTAPDQDLIASVVKDDEDEDKAEKFGLAVKRTGAFKLRTAWHFFESDVKQPAHRPLPVDCLPDHAWTANLDDTVSRDEAFSSGFVRNVFRYQELPPELALWMIDDLLVNAREDVNFEYLRTLEASPRSLRDALTLTKLTSIFRNLGGKTDSLDTLHEVCPSRELPNTPQVSIPPSLKWIVMLLGQAAAHLSAEPRLEALNLLCRLSFDDTILSNSSLQSHIRDTIEALISCTPDSELENCLYNLTQTLLTTISASILQNKLILSLPHSTPLTHLYQRHLALSFFLHPVHLTVSLDDPSIPSLIEKTFTSSKFHINKETDYLVLSSHLSILDVAIGPGLTAPPYLAPSTSPPIVPTDEERTFNAQVDQLAKRIRMINNEIVPAGGMSDLTICEAKEVADRLFYRLEEAVRTRGRKRRGAFGDEREETGQRERSVLGKWLGRSRNGLEETGNANGVTIRDFGV